LAALLLVWFVPLRTWHILLLCLAGVWLCGRAEALLNEHDSPKIVFDEFCGIFIASWQLEQALLLTVAFVLFRLLDIIKPYPVNKLQALPGGWGIMADDIAAGLAARLLILLIFRI